mmetsp:Transcript_24111/g.77808  ORF Transcript_24111/g.77808 Transcript_24111/m.77808 type:complete len:233 (-) Transcript_24111:1264-1962(-)
MIWLMRQGTSHSNFTTGESTLPPGAPTSTSTQAPVAWGLSSCMSGMRQTRIPIRGWPAGGACRTPPDLASRCATPSSRPLARRASVSPTSTRSWSPVSARASAPSPRPAVCARPGPSLCCSPASWNDGSTRPGSLRRARPQARCLPAVVWPSSLPPTPLAEAASSPCVCFPLPAALEAQAPSAPCATSSLSLRSAAPSRTPASPTSCARRRCRSTTASRTWRSLLSDWVRPS